MVTSHVGVELGRKLSPNTMLSRRAPQMLTMTNVSKCTDYFEIARIKLFRFR